MASDVAAGADSVQVHAVYVETDEEEQAVRVRLLDGSLGREISGQFVVKRGSRTIGGGNSAMATMALPPGAGIGWQTYGGGGGGGGCEASAGPVVEPGD
jgi:hypothetical protein